MSEENLSVRAKSQGDLVITEKCPQCGRVHKWIWPNHPSEGEKGTRRCGGVTLTVEFIPKSEYQIPKENLEKDIIEDLISKAKEGDEKAKKILKRMRD